MLTLRNSSICILAEIVWEEPKPVRTVSLDQCLTRYLRKIWLSVTSCEPRK
jgi:hypothetical protein